MSVKEQLDFLLSKVDDNKKGEFLSEIKKAVGLDAWIAVLQKFGVSLTDEEMQKLQEGTHELSDDDLDVVSGGCDGECESYEPCHQDMGCTFLNCF